MKTLITIDRRLGNQSIQRSMSIDVDDSTSLNDALIQIKNRVNSMKGVDRLAFFCHGYYKGGGLQYCKEGINLSNVHKFAALKGKVKRIILYACGAANKSNWKLCQELANQIKGQVVASTSIQILNLTQNGYPDFGKWEGNLFLFAHNASPGKLSSGNKGDSKRILEILKRMTDPSQHANITLY